MTIDDAFDQAVGLHQAGRVADAAQIFRQVIDRQPGHSSAVHHLAICLSQLGDFESSIPYYEAVLTANPMHAGCLNNLGQPSSIQLFGGTLGEVDLVRAEWYWNISLRTRPVIREKLDWERFVGPAPRCDNAGRG